MSFDEDRFERLAQAERTALVAFARRRLGDAPDDAEDAVQEALVKALRATRGGARPNDARAWLFTIVAHCCADARAGAARRATSPVPDGVELADPAPSVARSAETRDDVARAVQAIGRLPEAQRAALVAFELDGDSYEALGERHGWTVGATKSLLWRARTRLARERAGWAAWGGAPAAALRSLLAHAERPVSLVALPWSAEAIGCATLALVGVAAVGVPGDSGTPPSAAAAPPARHASPARASPRLRTVAGRTLALRDPTARPVARAAAPSDDPLAVVAACAAGQSLAGRFTARALLHARTHLPADMLEYSDCAGAVGRALAHPG